LVPFGSFVQVGDGIEGLVHISEMSAHHVDLPEQVVTPGEELWVKIIDLDLQRRRISLSIKQAAEGGIVAAEYQEHFGEHAYDNEGNYIGGSTDTPSDAEAAWAEYYAEHPDEAPPGGVPDAELTTATPGAEADAPEADVPAESAAEAAAPEAEAESPAESAAEAAAPEAEAEAESPAESDPEPAAPEAGPEVDLEVVADTDAADEADEV
ncbi:MAG: S1 RNA-binding domain-containing protein, partial [Acidimicrobiia bacterium]|nr:S1 RNA-binding domain-containing protein [Acidimicrobiia bacterium]